MPGQKRVIQVGVRGYGLNHLREIARLEAAGLVELVAAVDPSPGDFAGAPTFARLDEALDRQGADIVSIAAPIGAHASLATLALESGADVLLEKPPTASLGEFRALQEVAARTGRAVQVGFQSLGSSGVRVLRDALVTGVVGDGARVVAWGAWSRSDGYYERSAWAGHRVFNGMRVADGAVTNPLAHAVATALAVAGATHEAQVMQVETELYRTREIETDDTAWVGVSTTGGVPVQAILTLCAQTAGRDPSPSVAVMGERGSVEFRYTDDEVVWSLAGDADRVERVQRVGLLENLLAHQDDGDVELLAPLEATGAFMSVLEASQTSPLPKLIEPRFVSWSGAGDTRTPHLTGVEDAIEGMVRSGKPWSGSGAPWADSRPVTWRP